MLKIELNFEEKDVAQALRQAGEQNLALVEYINKLVAEDAVGEEADEPAKLSDKIIQELVELSVAGARKLEPDTEFLLANVCPPDQWALCTGDDRKKMGKRFRKAVEGLGVAQWIRRRSDNHSVYRRA